MDMCCSTTRFTTLTDSQASESCLAELSFLILAGVTRAVWLLLSSHSWYSTSLALSLFLASLTSSFLMRSLAAPDTPLHSLLWNSNLPCWMLLNRLSWQRSQAPQVATLVVLEVFLGVLDEGLDNLRCHE